MGSLSKQLKKNRKLTVMPDEKALELARNQGYQEGAAEMKKALAVLYSRDIIDAIESLKEVPGIGPVMLNRILKHFESEFRKKGQANGATVISTKRKENDE